MRQKLSWDEIQLLQYDAARLHNLLKEYELMIHNEKVKSTVSSMLVNLEDLIHHIKYQVEW